MSKLAQDDILPLPTDVGALANRINKATRGSHSKINNLINLKIVFALRDARIYRQGIQAFYHVFKTYEEVWQVEMNRKDDNGEYTRIAKILQQTWNPAITRTGPLTADLMFYYGSEEKFRDPVMPEQRAFVEHIREVCTAQPHLLLAYGHVMYLALFAGGRILRSNVARAVGLFPKVPGQTQDEVAAKGTNLFRFEVEDEEALRLEYKRNYELATRNDLTEEEKQDIIAESLDIFKRNTDCVSEISAKNSKAFAGKMGYKAAQAGYKLFLVLVALLVFYSVYSRLF
ncbi:Heme-binding protein [Yarrowia sp. B02]|nr:Heme-binding protein [Yarrowia sp. B02]